MCGIRKFTQREYGDRTYLSLNAISCSCFLAVYRSRGRECSWHRRVSLLAVERDIIVVAEKAEATGIDPTSEGAQVETERYGEGKHGGVNTSAKGTERQSQEVLAALSKSGFWVLSRAPLRPPAGGSLGPFGDHFMLNGVLHMNPGRKRSGSNRVWNGKLQSELLAGLRRQIRPNRRLTG